MIASREIPSFRNEKGTQTQKREETKAKYSLRISGSDKHLKVLDA